MCLGDDSFVGNAVGNAEEEGDMAAYEANAVTAKFGELREEMARRVAALRPMIMFVSASGPTIWQALSRHNIMVGSAVAVLSVWGQLNRVKHTLHRVSAE